MYSMKNTAMKALISLLFVALIASSTMGQTTPDSEGEDLLAVYYNAYFEMRSSFWEGPEKELNDNEVAQLKQVVQSLSKTAPQSIEALHVRYVHYGYQTEYGTDLKRAIGEQPGDYDELLVPHMFIQQAHDELQQSLERLSRKGVIQPAMLDYHLNMVQWLPRDAIVVTNGQQDTYALLLAKYMRNRDDLFILPLDYLHSEAFKVQVAEKLATDPAAAFFRSLGERPDRMEALDRLSAVGSVAVHFALTLPPSFLSSHKDLYAEGFSLSNRSQFSENPQLLYAQAIASVDLKRIDQNHPITVNYLPVLIAWYNASVMLGHSEQADKIASTVRLIADKTADANSVLKMIGK